MSTETTITEASLRAEFPLLFAIWEDVLNNKPEWRTASHEERHKRLLEITDEAELKASIRTLNGLCLISKALWHASEGKMNLAYGFLNEAQNMLDLPSLLGAFIHDLLTARHRT